MRRSLALTTGLAALAAPLVLGATAASAAPGTSDQSQRPERPTCTATDEGVVTVKPNRVTVSGNGTTGNSLECDSSIDAVAGETITFAYEGVECGAGVPRIFVEFEDGTFENTIDSDPQCATSEPGTVTYTLQNTGEIVAFGLVYDKQDLGSVTYSSVRIAGARIKF